MRQSCWRDFEEQKSGFWSGKREGGDEGRRRERAQAGFDFDIYASKLRTGTPVLDAAASLEREKQ